MTQAPMREPETEGKDTEEENEYKGTFVAVMILGLFLVVSWVGVWILFLVR